MEIGLLIISLLPVVIIGWYLYKKDKHKEPTKLLLKLFAGGVGSTIVTLAITYVMDFIFPFFASDSYSMNLAELFIYVFIGVALIEEFSKWLFVYFFGYKSQELDEFYDVILYAAFVALGFACFENVLYVLQGGLKTGLIRAVTAVPGHVFDGVFMGYYLGLAKINYLNKREKFVTKNIILSLAIPIVTHGLYDYFVFAFTVSYNWLFIILWLVLIIFMYIYCIKRVMKISNLTGNFYKNNINSVNNVNNQRVNMNVNQYNNINNNQNIYNNINNFCTNCGQKLNGNFCTNCGKKNM